VTPLHYAIGGGDAPHTSTLPVVVTPDASTRYTIPGLPPGHYYFTVSAILAGGLSSPSDEAEVVATGSTSADGPPTGALAVNDGGTFTVTWTRAQQVATVYYIEIGSAPGREDVATLSTTQPSITFRAGAATYYLRVRAVRAAVVSEPSNEVSVSAAPSICTAIPLAPVLLPVSTTSGETTISWLPAGGPRADHYRVDGTGRSGPTTMISPGTGTSLTAGLLPATYAIRVTAINACGAGAASNQIVFTILAGVDEATHSLK
jgi:predicted phage tail protein